MLGPLEIQVLSIFILMISPAVLFGIFLLSSKTLRSKVTFSTAFSFKGRVNRSTYWTMSWCVYSICFTYGLVISFLAAGLDAVLGDKALHTILIIFTIPYAIFLLWSSLALAAKRLHDMNNSAWWLLLAIAGVFAVLVVANVSIEMYYRIETQQILEKIGQLVIILIWVALGCLKGSDGPNRFGEDLLKTIDANFNRDIAPDKLKQGDAALANYDKALHMKPDGAEVYVNRGNAKYNMGQYDAAIADFDKAIQLKPDYAGAYVNRGGAKVKIGQYSDAIIDYDRAIQLKPDYADAYFNRGLAKEYAVQYDEAISDYDKVIQLSPNDVLAYCNRGNLNWALHRVLEAKQDFQIALSLAEKFGDISRKTTIEEILQNMG